MNRATLAHIMPHPVFGNLYTRNSVSLNKSTEKVSGITPVQASQISLLIPAFQQCSGTFWSCSRITSESLNTLMNRQYDSHLQSSSGLVSDPVGLPTRLSGGLSGVSLGHVTVSFGSGQRSAGSRSPAAWALTGATFSIPSLESILAFTVV